MSSPTIQKAIIKGFLSDETFVVQAIAYIKPEYFKSLLEKEIITEAIKFFTEYKKLPSEAALIISVSKNLPAQENIEELNTYIESLKELSVPTDWLTEKTEEFCRNSDFRISIEHACDIIDGDSKVSIYEIPKLIQNSLSISFKQTASHDYFRDVENQLSWYNEKVNKIPFGLQMLDTVTGGGIERSTLNVILAGTGVGKTLTMCHLTMKYIELGYNVMYFTLEMAEKKIRQRIDANLLDIRMDSFANLDAEFYYAKMRRIQERIKGNLKIQFYPAATITVNHFRRTLEDLNLKDGFKPDIIVVDYLTLMNSARLRQAKKYEVIQAIAEETHGLAAEYDAGLWTGTQVNREGYKDKNSNLGMENTSDSMGLPFTADFFIALSADETMQKAQHMRVTQLKSRYGDINYYNKFILGVDKQKMRLYDVVQPDDKKDDKPKEDKDDVPGFDRSEFGRGMRGETVPKRFDDFEF